MKKGVKVFTLPGEEMEATDFMNQDLVDIVYKERVACPKEGIILLYLEYEDYREE